MKAEIKRVIHKNGDGYFHVFANDKYITCYIYYDFDEKEKYAKALKLAKIIEETEGETFESKTVETVYKTSEVFDRNESISNSINNLK